MAQTYETLVSGATTFGQLYAKVNNLVEALRSNFSGTSFPISPSPTEGQPCYRTDEDKLYIYRNAAWEEIPLSGTLWQEIINARGTKPSIDQRLDVAMNEDGTLKAATSLNPSQWYKPSLTFTYLSATSFKVNGDQTDIYKPTRRLKINLTGSTVYSEVVSASYSAPDTTVQIYDAVLTSALIDVEHSLFLPTKENGALSPEMLNEKIVSKTTTYTTTLNDKVVKCDASGGAFTVTVLAAATAGAGRRQAFKKTDTSANAVTINCGFNIVLLKYGETVEIESDGTNWFKVTDLDNYLVNADLISDFVVSGLLGSDPGASLAMTIPGGTAYVMGKRVAKSSADADLTKTYTASKDTYVDISNAGAITYTEVANGAAAPAVAANSIRTQKVVTNGTEITGVTDLRVLNPNGAAAFPTSEITVTSQAMSSNTRYVANNASEITFTCPASPVLGDVCTVEGKGTGGWKITPASGQEIQLRGYKTGVSIQSGHYMDCVSLVYANNNLWVAEILTELDYAQIRTTGGKGYIMGGYTTVAVAAIEDLIFSNETSQAITATLDTAKNSGVGVNSSTKGYIMGGYTTVVVAVIEDFIFSNETSQAIAATLDTAKDYGVGVNSSTKGYIMGGHTTAVVAVIEDLIFSNETSQAITATLDTAKRSGAGVNSSIKGYIMGGYTTGAVAVIEDFIFSNETSQAIAATLDTAKDYGVGVNSSTKGYIMGGHTTVVVAVIEDLIFSNETSQAIAATLDTAKDSGAGVNSSIKGYIMGGEITVAVAVIEDFIFSNETSQAITATLDTAKYAEAGVQYGYL